MQGFWARWLERRIPAASTVQLSRQHIFIRPTRVGLGYLLLLLLMLLTAINYQSSLAYGLTFLLFSVFAVAILHSYRNLAGLLLQGGGSVAVFAGDQAVLPVRMESLRHAHEAITLGWHASARLTRDVAAGAASDVELSLKAVKRGWLRPGRIRLESRFPLGILVAWSHIDLQQRVLVYPRPVAGELAQLAGGSMADESVGQLALGQGSDDFQGLRSYRPGDPRQRLDWKAYSRGQGLLVKDFTAHNGSQLVLDFNSLSGDVESRLSLLCYWVLQLSAQRQPFTLKLLDSCVIGEPGERHRDQCLRALALYGSGQ